MIRYLLVITVFCAFTMASQHVYAAPSWFESFFADEEEVSESAQAEVDKPMADEATADQGSQQAKPQKRPKKWKGKRGKGKHGAKRKGPPAHAPAHGYRAKFKHYPAADIYENTVTGTFFQKVENTWKALESLPEDMKLDSGVEVKHWRKVPPGVRKLKK